MKVTISFNGTKIVVPCGDGALSIRELINLATTRYKKAIGKPASFWVMVSSLKSYEGGILDPDDTVGDVCDDREQLQALFDKQYISDRHGTNSNLGDGMSSDTSSNELSSHPKELLTQTTMPTHDVFYGSDQLDSFSTFDSKFSSSLCVSRRREPLGASANRTKSEPEGGLVKSAAKESPSRCGPLLFEIIIPNEAGPLGIHVVPCDDDGRLVVAGIESGGRIDRDGRLAVGDQIIQINGFSLTSTSFAAAQEIFKECLQAKNLALLVLKTEQTSTSELEVGEVPYIFAGEALRNKVELAVQPPVASLIPGTKITSAVNANNTRKIGKMLEISLKKGACGLGFSITTRDNAPGGKTPVYIKNILPKGAAIEEGSLKPGDRLLQVNGICVDGMSQSDVVNILRNAPSDLFLHLTVSRHLEVPTTSKVPLAEEPSGALSDFVNPFGTTGVHREIFTFDIPVHDTERAGLGVSVKGSTRSSSSSLSSGCHAGEVGSICVDSGIFVKSVINGGAASRDGRLRNNDQLININGISLLGKSNPVAMELLRKAMHEEGPMPGIISLTIARRSGIDDKTVRNFNPSVSGAGRLDDNSSNLAYSASNKDSHMEKAINGVIPVKHPVAAGHFRLPKQIVSSRNPVVDRLMGKTQNSYDQYPQHSKLYSNLRNESYYEATRHEMNGGRYACSLMSAAVPVVSQKEEEEAVDTLKNGHSSPPFTTVQNLAMNSSCELDSSLTPVLNTAQVSRNQQQISSNSESMSSLMEIYPGFCRDQPGRQSMSEKRHATLDAKTTETYQKRKKLREERTNNIVTTATRTGLRIKSSSLESIVDKVGHNPHARTSSVRSPSKSSARNRNRVCNDSFRAAVDRSYDDEEDDIPAHEPSRHIEKKIKPKLLRNLGNMFRHNVANAGHKSKVKKDEGGIKPKSAVIVKTRGLVPSSESKDDVYDSTLPLTRAMTIPGSRVGIVDPLHLSTPSFADYEAIHMRRRNRMIREAQADPIYDFVGTRPKSNYYDLFNQPETKMHHAVEEGSINS